MVPFSQGGRKLEHVTLMGGVLGEIGIIISLPDPMPNKKMPVLMVLGGLGTGDDNIREIKDAGDNVIVGYDWPIPVKFPQGNEFIKRAPALYERAMVIPGQVASAIGWLVQQPWADEKRLSILGYSLGALAAPAVANLAQHDGHPIGWTILAYGGAPLGDLFAANTHMKPPELRKAVAPVIDILLHPLQPTKNLPNVTSHFLVLEGREDSLIPREARLRLRDAVPKPKDVKVFSGEHMGVGTEKQELLDEIIKASREWLVQSGAINGP
jgi:surfactin synthase thioesterase subunit